MKDIKKVAPINKPYKAGPNVDRCLAEVTRAVQAGGVANLMIVTIHDDRAVSTVYANSGHRFAMVGGLEALKQEFIFYAMEVAYD